jgi:uncharacterized protein (TIGR00369 family)
VYKALKFYRVIYQNLLSLWKGCMEIQNLTGLELMKSMVEGKIPPAPIGETIPMRGVEVAKGYIKFLAKADKRHINPLGGVHGGFAATVLDSVTGCSVHTMLEAGVGYATVDLNIKMIKPVPLNRELIAEGKVIHLSHNIGISEGTLKDEDGKLYAHATATCIIFK